MRALNTEETGQTYLDGWVLDFKLFRPHMALNDRTPAAAPGADVPLNSWTDIAAAVKPIGESGASPRPDEMPGFVPRKRKGRQKGTVRVRRRGARIYREK